AVGARVIVGPGDRRGVLVVAHRGRINGVVVEFVDHTQRPEPVQTTPQVLMVAGGEHTAPICPESQDGFGIGGGQAIADINCHQPHLVETSSSTRHRTGSSAPALVRLRATTSWPAARSSSANKEKRTTSQSSGFAAIVVCSNIFDIAVR